MFGRKHENNNLCDYCNGCCKEGSAIMLSVMEFDRLILDGTKLAILSIKDLNKSYADMVLAEAENFGVAHPWVPAELKSDCANLVPNNLGRLGCRIHEDPSRPVSCQKFRVNSNRCREIRIEVELQDEIDSLKPSAGSDLQPN